MLKKTIAGRPGVGSTERRVGIGEQVGVKEEASCTEKKKKISCEY
jgi:hypothetical protein